MLVFNLLDSVASRLHASRNAIHWAGASKGWLGEGCPIFNGFYCKLAQKPGGLLTNAYHRVPIVPTFQYTKLSDALYLLNVLVARCPCWSKGHIVSTTLERHKP